MGNKLTLADAVRVVTMGDVRWIESAPPPTPPHVMERGVGEWIASIDERVAMVVARDMKLKIVRPDNSERVLNIKAGSQVLIAESFDAPPPVDPPPGGNPPLSIKMRVINPKGMNVRQSPSLSGKLVGNGVAFGQVIEVNAQYRSMADGLEWFQLYTEDSQFIAYRQGNVKYLEPLDGVSLPQVPTTPTPDPVPSVIEAGYGWNLRSYLHRGDMGEADWMQAQGAKWVRVYLAKQGMTLGQCLTVADAKIEALRARGINVVLVVTDSLGISGFNIDADLPFHKGPDGHLTIDWYKPGPNNTPAPYKGAFLQWVNGAAEWFKDTPGVILSPMNEGACYTADRVIRDADYQAYATMWTDVVQVVDGRMAVINDCVNGRHFAPSNAVYKDVVRDFYRRTGLDAVVGHLYGREWHQVGQLVDFEADFQVDAQVARELNLPVVLGEIGVHMDNPERVRVLEGIVARWVSAWVRLYWGLGLGADNQDSDVYAMARFRDGVSEFEGMAEALL